MLVQHFGLLVVERQRQRTSGDEVVMGFLMVKLRSGVFPAQGPYFRPGPKGPLEEDESSPSRGLDCPLRGDIRSPVGPPVPAATMSIERGRLHTSPCTSSASSSPPARAARRPVRHMPLIFCHVTGPSARRTFVRWSASSHACDGRRRELVRNGCPSESFRPRVQPTSGCQSRRRLRFTRVRVHSSRCLRLTRPCCAGCTSSSGGLALPTGCGG